MADSTAIGITSRQVVPAPSTDVSRANQNLGTGFPPQDVPPDATTRAAGSSSSHFISRSSSTQSAMTSVTADLSSHTPLLGASDSDPSSFLESQQPAQPVGASFESRRPRSLGSDGYPVARRRKRTLRDTRLRKRLRMLKMFKCGLEAFLGVWTVFNVIRYLVSYARYITTQGQVSALALALSSCLSLAFLCCAVLLSTSRKSLKRRIPPRASHVIRKTIRFIAALLILAPAVANVVLLFSWKDSDNQEVSFNARCHVDIDLVWSTVQDQCSGPPWGVWVALGFVRLAITQAVLVAYFVVCHSYGRTLQLSTSHRLSVLPPYETAMVRSATPTMKETHKHRPSHSSFISNVESTVAPVLPYHSAPKARVTHSGSSTSSEDDYATRHLPPGLVYSQEEKSDNTCSDNHFRAYVSDDDLSHTRMSDDEDEDDTRIGDYSSQPSSESSHASYSTYASYSSYTAYLPTYTSYTPYSYNLPPLPPSIGYNEFGQPYPPDEPLPILNGIIRRMPTIESMGSRELGSIVTSSSMYTGTNLGHNGLPGSARSTMTFDRPPTRPISRTDLVAAASCGCANAPPSSSRPNSLGARAELMASLGATELGELMSSESGSSASAGACACAGGQARPTTDSYLDQGNTSNNNTSGSSNNSHQPPSMSRATSAGTSTSRSSTVLSFHTATSGSMYSSPH